MIAVADLTTWLQAQSWWPRDGVGPLAVYSPDQMDLKDLADRCVFVFPTAGSGFLLEQAFEVPAAQLRIRGAQGNYPDAESLANVIDRGLAAAWPTTIGAKAVQYISRVGGAPAYLLRDTARRSHFTGNYLFTVAY